MGDNFSVQVVSKGKDHLDAAVRMAFSNCPGGKAKHYIGGLPERGCGDCHGSGKQYGSPLAPSAYQSVEYKCK